MRIDGGSNLLTARFPRRLEEGMANAEGDCEIGLHAPGILHIPLEFIGAEMAIKECAVGKQGT